jgi:hypothetical protein
MARNSLRRGPAVVRGGEWRGKKGARTGVWRGKKDARGGVWRGAQAAREQVPKERPPLEQAPQERAAHEQGPRAKRQRGSETIAEALPRSRSWAEARSVRSRMPPIAPKVYWRGFLLR